MSSITAKKRKWRRDNPARMSAIYRRYREKDPMRRLLLDSRKRSKRRGIKFELTSEDVVIPKTCPIMGWELTNVQGCGNSVRTNISLDRIDSNLGYEKGNVQVICRLANIMKNEATKEELILFAKGILRHYGENP